MPSRKNVTASLRYERQYCAQGGCARIVGMDEVGRGAWAGPVAVGAVCLPVENLNLGMQLAGVRDSKQMTPRQRSTLVDKIKATAIAWGIGSATSDEIDSGGIVKATRLAMQRALDDTRTRAPDFLPDCLFLDSILWPETKIAQVSIMKGDTLSLSIAAASVIAKVWRDTLMATLDADYPQYGFAVHKGYGVPQHEAAIKQHGASAIHRKSFRPMREG
jgi:ribonuclease HII